ncbi:hypothetical protein [Delftia sp. JD2]|uniref:hypothetical protein n=1 Tax=Delftia sp. JD2 TaxID=469553 RepID=UPI000806CB5F|nr:hypothetical protein [Delftia sp. JD2]OBY87071.1 hypothetical protein ACM14_02790 [Delftia sp. JD2]
MTILNSNFDAFKRCADGAPEGTYQQAKDLNELFGDTCAELMRSLRAMGLKAGATDLIYKVEAGLNDYVKQSNPECPMFPMAEGFGLSLDGSAAARVIAQGGRDREALDTSIASKPTYYAGEWLHLFGPGRRETRCRIAIAVRTARVVAAHVWTGLRFENMSESMRTNIEESVIGVNEALLSPADFGLKGSTELPAWALNAE